MSTIYWCGSVAPVVKPLPRASTSRGTLRPATCLSRGLTATIVGNFIKQGTHWGIITVLSDCQMSIKVITLPNVESDLLYFSCWIYSYCELCWRVGRSDICNDEEVPDWDRDIVGVSSLWSNLPIHHWHQATCGSQTSGFSWLLLYLLQQILENKEGA